MKDLLKIMLVLMSCFATTFFVIKMTGIITIADIERGFQQLSHLHPAYIVVLVAALLWADLFIAIPTMTVSLLAGYFLGWGLAALAVITGLLLAGGCGYGLSRVYGTRLLRKIYPETTRREAMETIFTRYGVLILAICRALPMLPEVSCCMAGATRMSAGRFALAYALGTLPYAVIVTYAGSISSWSNPAPAIIILLALSGSLLAAWLLLFVYAKRSMPPNIPA